MFSQLVLHFRVVEVDSLAGYFLELVGLLLIYTDEGFIRKCKVSGLLALRVRVLVLERM